ncbi:MAG: arsenite methyltransferase [Chloroflexi bacterium]|nr:arsenite methyltransferase [Chloroflexota bacterium]
MSKPNINQDNLKVKTAVREHYAEAAVKKNRCCGDSNCGCGTRKNKDEITSTDFYKKGDLESLPEEVTGISLGCGDPVTLASLRPGQTVLDLGSGGGIDCFIAGNKVGPTGRVIGVDMTPEMLDRARASCIKLNADNVEFRLGEIEHLPVSDNVIDVVISNCVINLSTDKPQVLQEIFRVLKPGGRMAVSDIVTRGELPETVKTSLSAWAGCIAGAMDGDEMVVIMKKIGFSEITLTPVYFTKEMAQEIVQQLSIPASVDVDKVLTSIFSADISAKKPKK